jgi:XTP/dITP diphosphohydrolase
MRKKIFFATRNEGKIQRFSNLLEQAGINVEIYTPKDFGLEKIDVEENGKTLAENAELKARAYLGKVNMPILANDTGFWVQGEGFVDAPRRKALSGAQEKDLTQEEIAATILSFWKNIAKKHGGKVDAQWQETFILLEPDGKIHKSESKREVILTDKEFGQAHIQMPMRALYISKTTNKPAIKHSKEEEFLELEPVTRALREVLIG